MPTIEMRAVLPPGSWRDASAYAALAATGARGLAWELLRRHPDYPGGADEGDGRLTAADAAFTARWGLHFRRGAEPLCVHRTFAMVGRLRSVGAALPNRAARGAH